MTSRREGERKSQGVKESKSQGVKESKSQREEETEGRGASPPIAISCFTFVTFVTNVTYDSLHSRSKFLSLHSRSKSRSRYSCSKTRCRGVPFRV